MSQPDVIAAPASRPLARLEKRAGDSRAYLIDCQPLLRQHELLTKVLEVRASGLTAGAARTRGGRFVEVHLSGGGAGKGRYTDGEVVAVVQTSMGQLEVCIAARVHGGGAA